MSEQQELLKKIDQELKQLSVSQLATMMGYRSPNTVRKWITDKKIPATAVTNVQTYFKEKRR